MQTAIISENFMEKYLKYFLIWIREINNSDHNS